MKIQTIEDDLERHSEPREGRNHPVVTGIGQDRQRRARIQHEIGGTDPHQRLFALVDDHLVEFGVHPRIRPIDVESSFWMKISARFSGVCCLTNSFTNKVLRPSRNGCGPKLFPPRRSSWSFASRIMRACWSASLPSSVVVVPLAVFTNSEPPTRFCSLLTCELIAG